jgi:hypothetical protein
VRDRGEQLMLVKRAVLDRIAAGEVDTVFRRQQRPTVKAGGTLRTAVGVLDILEVTRVALDEIDADDARRAGYGDVESLLSDLRAKPDGVDYRVRVRFGGADPRLALRERSELSADDVAELVRRLDRFDDASPRGAWTRQFLALIGEHPHVRAPDLAASVGWEVTPFKANVRKLKDLGLTISHSPGYELSPRGHSFRRASTVAPTGSGCVDDTS